MTARSPNLAAARHLWITETLRLYARFQMEFVEAFDFCPWAKRARLDGHVKVDVCLDLQLNPEPVLAHIDACIAEAEIEIGILIFPRSVVDRETLERFATRCMALDSQRLGLQSAQFVLAAFHPDAPLVLDPPDRLVPFLRRSPDPTLQFVRTRALERVRRGESSGTQFVDLSTLDFTKLAPSAGPSLRERIMSANRDTIQRTGSQEVNEVLASLLQDKQETRARLPELQAEGRDA
jgi:hypothetical protein